MARTLYRELCQISQIALCLHDQDFAGAGLEAEWRRGYGGSFGRDGPEQGGENE